MVDIKKTFKALPMHISENMLLIGTIAIVLPFAIFWGALFMNMNELTVFAFNVQKGVLLAGSFLFYTVLIMKYLASQFGIEYAYSKVEWLISFAVVSGFVGYCLYLTNIIDLTNII